LRLNEARRLVQADPARAATAVEDLMDTSLLEMSESADIERSWGMSTDELLKWFVSNNATFVWSDCEMVWKWHGTSVTCSYEDKMKDP
jgi:hypothetical protein